MAKPLIDTINPSFLRDIENVDEVEMRLREAIANDASKEAASLLESFSENSAVRALMCSVFASSPFLSNIIERRPTLAWQCLATDPDAHMMELIEGLWPNLRDFETETEVMKVLRESREQAALLVALCDLAGRWPVMTVTEKLSNFADAAISGAVNWLLLEAAKKGDYLASSQTDPALDSAYCVFAMGKLGAHELNYSSDIDLIIFYDPEAALLADGIEPATFFIRLTRSLVKLLQEQTQDGYVFRVDLRLRPDPGATAVAIALEAAGQYYESLGQNWERAAMIKARAVAGDSAVGEEFLNRIKPFIWRKHLDFAAIADVHSMKRQIHTHKGHGEIAVAGHNIKLGRGGIREIEFFAQTQQLIAGGRVLELRTQKTLDTLKCLVEQQWITPEAEREMHEAYLFLRHIEHRLQMRNDEQTHTLPKDDNELETLAHFAGFDSTEAFAKTLTKHLTIVQGHYAALFEDAPDLGVEEGSLVFTGSEDDPATLETLSSMGFAKPTELTQAVRAWHFGRYPATRSLRTREILTELMPQLLRALAQTANPDAAFSRFDDFLQDLPAGVQLFSLLRANPEHLKLIATLMGSAPRLASLLSRQASVLDAVIDPDFFSKPNEQEFDRQITERFALAENFEDILDEARTIANDQRFAIGMQQLVRTLDPIEAAVAYAQLASAIIKGLLWAVGNEIEKAHGRIKGGRAAIIAMGKLGGREMAATSDLDIMVIYDFAREADKSDGPRPLDPVTYYTRLTQRLISALSVPTAQGQLYEVDMRLRPSGRAGPIATKLASFIDYQQASAWTWEHMALTRARVIAGDDGMRDQIEAVIFETLSAKRDHANLVQSVCEMRDKIDQEKHTTNPWNTKNVRGGLLDLEFICQFLQLAHAAAQPEILDQNTGLALAKLAKAKILNSTQAETLMEAYGILTAISQILRLSIEGDVVPETMPEDLKRLLAGACDEPDFERLSYCLTACQEDVKTLYNQLIT